MAAETKYLETLVVRTFHKSKGKKRNQSYLADREWGDLNKGHKGNWSYVEAVWTTHRERAASHIHVHIHEGKKGGKGEDYAKGCANSHKYRYITVSSKDSNKKINEVRLVDQKLDGWQHTRNLNAERGGRDLYIAYRWKGVITKRLAEHSGVKFLIPNDAKLVCAWYGHRRKSASRYDVLNILKPGMEVQAKNKLFGDPCVGVGKVLYIEYVKTGPVKPKISCTNVEFKEVKWRTVFTIPAKTELTETIQTGLKNAKSTENKQETETSKSVTWSASAKLGGEFGWFKAEGEFGLDKNDAYRKLSTRLNSFTKELTGSKITGVTYKEMDVDTEIIQAVIVGWCKEEETEYALKTKFTRRVDSSEDWPALPKLTKLM